MYLLYWRRKKLFSRFISRIQAMHRLVTIRSHVHHLTVIVFLFHFRLSSFLQLRPALSSVLGIVIEDKEVGWAETP